MKTIFYRYSCRLYELRANGITTCYGGQIYENMKIVRMNKTTAPKQSLDIDWKNLTENSIDTLTGTEQMLKHCVNLNQLPKKRKSTPLNIIGLNIVYFKLNIRNKIKKIISNNNIHC